MTDNIRAAIADLEARRDTLTTAIETLKSLDSPREEAARNLGRSVGRSVGRQLSQRGGTPAVTSDPNDDALRAAIVEALQTGPASPKDVTTKVGADKLAVRFAFKELLASGRVKAEGSTGNRKWMLARTQSRPAKEAP